MNIKRFFSQQYKSLQVSDMFDGLIQAEYAVRGKIPIAADKIEQDLKNGIKYPFDQLVYCNIGNPLSFGQKPVTFNRQVLSGIINPDQINEMPYSQDVKDRVLKYKDLIKGSIGAYSDSKGYNFVRKSVADFIYRRDGYTSNSDDIYLTGGASDGIGMIIKALIKNTNQGIMIPIPQYPLYSATISLQQCQQIHYYLEEEDDWNVNIDDLNKSYAQSVSQGIEPKIFILINPGNPTGQVMSQQKLKQIVKFCEEKNLILLSDEVYQENVYLQDKKFVSMKKVVNDLQSKVNLFSFHSTSKGLLGECGLRGGYVEVTNVSDEVQEQLLKLKSINLCSNTIGQLAVDLMIRPPSKEDGCSENTIQQHQHELNILLSSLKYRADIVYESLNSMDNIKCRKVQGAMYAFPSVFFSEKVLKKAKELNVSPDFYYCMEVLKNTGIVIVPGSGFKQKDGTNHFRITTLILSEDYLIKKLNTLKEFNNKFHSQ